ncbi:MAG TPA: type I-U CRISPR-associated protein Csb2 [Vicinamibacterales bacterium]|nr:type I-U CRISPR-associated protein Csb2 [Vicinamibacterales bacterium]
MSLTVSIRFLAGRAHLHPWQTHHSEGRVEWPPSHWRLLRAIVAVAGRGLTSLPYPDDVPPPKPELMVTIEGMPSLRNRGVPADVRKKLSFSKARQELTLEEQLTDDEADAWKAANPGESFAAAIDGLRELAATPGPIALADVDDDEIPLSHLASVLRALSTTPTIWLPKTGGGHTRQYFPIHEGGMVKNTGSAVFDTFATVRKDQPLLFHWPEADVDERQQAHLKLILGRMTYFGRAESWCRAEAHSALPARMKEIVTNGRDQTHWECVCIDEGGRPAGKEYREYTLERRLSPVKNLEAEVSELMPRTRRSDGKNRDQAAAESFKALLQSEAQERLLLRCLLRESGQDIKDGLERPIGTRWIHYAVPRAVFDVPRPKPQPRPRAKESVDLVRYALNTATVNRPVLPPLADAVLVADHFRNAAMAVCRQPGRALSGHEQDGSPCKGHQHAFWWPLDEDDDGFIDHVVVRAPGGFEDHEIDALRRLTRLRQRGGRPDLLVTPVFVGQEVKYGDWQNDSEAGGATVCVSATPYFCPVHLSHGRKSSGRTRSLKREIIKGLLAQGIAEAEDEVSTLDEIVFDFAPAELAVVSQAVASHVVTEPIPPRQFFPVTEAPGAYPSLPRTSILADERYRNAVLKDPDDGYCFGSSIGLLVDHGTRFVRALSFGQRRRGHEVRGHGRMLRITFTRPRLPRPFAIGSLCHFGLGLFVPVPRPRVTTRTNQ